MLSALNPKDSAVLVVEDNPDDGLIVAKALQTFGIKKVYAAETAEQALQVLEKHVFEVALVDYNLPGMNGLRFAERVRESWPETRVVMVTGVRDERVAVAAMKAGAADYVTKDELLTSSVIRSLQAALRERIATTEEHHRAALAADSPALELALEEAESLAEGWLESSDQHRPNTAGQTTSVLGGEYLADALEAFTHYIRGAFRGLPERARAREEALVRLLFDQGVSPAEIVAIYRAALRSLALDGPNLAFNPLVCLARIAMLLVDEYQRAQSVQSLSGPSA